MRRGAKLGEAVGHQFLSAGPEEVLPAADDELAADSVPFPLREPVGARAERIRPVGADAVCQAERIGPRQPRALVRRLHEGSVGRRVRGPVAHQAMRELGLVAPRRCGERAGHELAADADPEAPGQQLVEDQPLLRLHPVPGIENRGLARFVIRPVERPQARDPHAKTVIMGRRARAGRALWSRRGRRRSRSFPRRARAECRRARPPRRAASSW